MTTETLRVPTDAELNRKAAEIVGYHPSQAKMPGSCKNRWWYLDCGDFRTDIHFRLTADECWIDAPDFCSSRDACAELEAVVCNSDGSASMWYGQILCRLLGVEALPGSSSVARIATASPHIRVIACLQALGLWDACWSTEAGELRGEEKNV